jgi:Methylenetetrahydrofolate reductase
LEGSTSSHLVGDPPERLGVFDHDTPAPGLHIPSLPEPAVTVEIDLPRGNVIRSVVEAARRLQRRGVDAIDISDGARARLRMHPVAAAKIVQDEAAIEVVAHISCRDRNIIGLQADLLGAGALVHLQYRFRVVSYSSGHENSNLRTLTFGKGA